MVKNLPAMQESQVQSLGQEDPLEKGMATHFSILAWEIPRTGESGRQKSMGSQRVGHDWVTNFHFHCYIYSLFSSLGYLSSSSYYLPLLSLLTTWVPSSSSYQTPSVPHITFKLNISCSVMLMALCHLLNSFKTCTLTLKALIVLYLPTKPVSKH